MAVLDGLRRDDDPGIRHSEPLAAWAHETRLNTATILAMFALGIALAAIASGTLLNEQVLAAMGIGP